MTIQFYCPNCDALIAFDSKHAGKRARCTTCGQILIIPSKDNEVPQKIKPEPERTEPLPGFYRAVFVDSWKIFRSRTNVTGLIFVAAVVCFKFFVRHMNYTVIIHGRSLTFYFPVPFGIVMTITSWGCLFWYYMQFIYATAFDAEQLPEVHLASFYRFIWNILKSLYIFFIILLMVELPYIITILLSRKMGVEWPVLSHILMLGGLFLFPMAILTTAVGKDLTMLRPDYLFAPVFRAFMPYLMVVVLLVAASVLEMQTSQYERLPFAATAAQLMLNFVVQIIAIIAMRSIGLFYRHYSCYLKW